MIDLTTFAAARQFLETEGYRVSIGETEVDPQTPALILDLLDDEDGPKWLLQMVIINDLAPTIDEQSDDQPAEAGGVTLLQFTTVAPGLTVPEAMVECMRAAFLVNTIMPIGGVGLIEAQRRFYFDYKLALAEPSIAESVLIETVEMLAFGAEAYGGPLLEVAAGRLSVEGLLLRLQGEADGNGDAG